MFKEWKTAKKMTVTEIQPGAPVALGKIAGQDLAAAEPISGKVESLAASNDLQFVLEGEQLDELMAKGSPLVKVIESGIETGF